jgi:uncharacterized protein (TIGR02145 family)
MRYLDGVSGTSSPYDSKTAGRYLKATDGWNNGGNGQDTYGFSARPGGFGASDGSFHDVGNYGYWWSATEYNAYNAYYRGMKHDEEGTYYYSGSKGGLYSVYSVRCLQN